MGAKRLHGPHQSAQKSTSTMSLLVIVSSKVSVLMSSVAIGSPRRMLCRGGKPLSRRGDSPGTTGLVGPIFRVPGRRRHAGPALLDGHEAAHRDGHVDRS